MKKKKIKNKKIIATQPISFKKIANIRDEIMALQGEANQWKNDLTQICKSPVSELEYLEDRMDFDKTNINEVAQAIALNNLENLIQLQVQISRVFKALTVHECNTPPINWNKINNA